MRVERLGDNKVRVFISYDDLDERGIDRDEIWLNGRKVQELFWDMMEHAYSEVGFEVEGPIAVEAFTMPTEGVVVIVTQIPPSSYPSGQQADAEADEEIEVEVSELTTDPFGAFTFVFQDFEDAIRAAHALHAHEGVGGTLYHYKNRYHLFFEEDEIGEELYDTIWSILHEFGELSSTTKAMLDEYGKRVMDGNAITTLVTHFPLR